MQIDPKKLIGEATEYDKKRRVERKQILDSYEFQEHYTEEMKPEFKSSNSEFWLIFKNLNYIAKNIGNDLSAKNADKKMPIKKCR